MNIKEFPGPAIIEPGLSLIQSDLEKYSVAGAGALVFEVAAGDQITIIDPEGAQTAELLAFDNQGRSDLGVFGLRPCGRADGTGAILSAGRSGTERVLRGLSLRNISVIGANAHHLFAPDSPAGSSASFVAGSDATCVVSAPGEDMLVDAQNPPTEIIVHLKRSQSVDLCERRLPDPPFDPILDMRVKRMTAQSYEVKAGQYIQIIDVAGRECSDMQAFDSSRLDRGVESCIDLTGTRTFMGAAFPVPGLYAKYYSEDMQPMLEVIQDTVGRHDTFGYACTSKYYEDQGYFGHPNCTENFNNALQSYDIGRRRGWDAINFFYNTNVDDSNQIYLDEPWSRPGDYVLLQALTDLVCVSSACPDDTCAANAWNPTDIHVRVYPKNSEFKKAIAYRMKPDAEPKLTRETGFHSRTSFLTRNFTEYKGFWLPTHFNNGGAQAEYYACRNNVAVMDLSPLRKFEVLGPDAEQLMQWTATRNVKKLAQNQVVYTAMCYEHGGMFDDGTIFRLGTDNFRWIGGDEFGGEWLRKQAAEQGLERVNVKSSTDHLSNIAVQGPNSRDLMKKIIWTPPSQAEIGELQWFRFSVGRIGDHNGIPVMVSRTGYTGELGFEVFCHPKNAPEVWDTVWTAGQEYGISAVGLDALDMLRIEAGLIFADYEFNDQTDPFEAGIGFAVALKTKQDDFLGKEALIRRKAYPTQKLVGLELRGNEPAAHGDCVHLDSSKVGSRAQVGVITSAMRSPILSKNIALCRMNITHTEIGTKVEVGKLDGHQKRLPATVVPFPFYDPDKSRVRA